MDNSGFKFWYTEKVRSKNRVGIIVDKKWKKYVMEIVNIMVRKKINFICLQETK